MNPTKLFIEKGETGKKINLNPLFVMHYMSVYICTVYNVHILYIVNCTVHVKYSIKKIINSYSCIKINEGMWGGGSEILDMD